MGSKSRLHRGYLQMVAFVWITVLGRRGVLGIGQGGRRYETQIYTHQRAWNGSQ